FFCNDTATTEIYTLSLHDALPISAPISPSRWKTAPTGSRCPLCSAPRLSRRSEEHTSELQSHHDLVCRLLLEKKKKNKSKNNITGIQKTGLISTGSSLFATSIGFSRSGMAKGFFFFFNDTATTEIYTLSLHDALPSSSAISRRRRRSRARRPCASSARSSAGRSEEHTSELQSHHELVCRLLLEKK